GLPLLLRRRLLVIRGLASAGRFLLLSRHHGDAERGSPVLRADVAEVLLDLFGRRIRPLLVHAEHRLSLGIGEADLAEAALARGAHARADEPQAAIARGLGECVEAFVPHSLSIT